MQRIDLQELSERRGLGPVRLAALGTSKACELSILSILLSMIRMIEREVKERPDLFQGIKLQLSKDAAPKPVLPKRRIIPRVATGEPWWMAASAMTRVMNRNTPNCQTMLKYEAHDTTVGLQAFISGLAQQVRELASRTGVSVSAAYEAEERRQRNRLAQSVKSKFKVDAENLMSAADVRDEILVSVQATSAQVRGLGEEVVKRLEFNILDAAAKGQSTKVLEERLKKEVKAAKTRARMIARYQSASFTSVLAKSRQDQFGIDDYIWQTAMDERVRPVHAQREGKRFSWDDPPAGGHPGEDFNCRCIAVPIIEGKRQKR